MSNLTTGVQFLGRESNSHYHAHKSCLTKADATYLNGQKLLIPQTWWWSSTHIKGVSIHLSGGALWSSWCVHLDFKFSLDRNLFIVQCHIIIHLWLVSVMTITNSFLPFLISAFSISHFCIPISKSTPVYRIAPNFHGTIFSWISWFDFWSQKFSSRKFSMLMVGVAMCCAAQWTLARAGG